MGPWSLLEIDQALRSVRIEIGESERGRTALRISPRG